MCLMFCYKQGYKVYYTTRKAYPLSARQAKRTPSQKIRLDDLLPNATYIISISPYNAAGDGPMSDDHYCLILPGGMFTYYLTSFNSVQTKVAIVICVFSYLEVLSDSPI